MIYWIIYDIENDRNRTIISTLIMERGFYRVQKSSFVGGIDNQEMEDLILEMCGYIDNTKDSVFTIPVAKGDLNKITALGNSPDIFELLEESKLIFI